MRLLQNCVGVRGIPIVHRDHVVGAQEAFLPEPRNLRNMPLRFYAGAHVSLPQSHGVKADPIKLPFESDRLVVRIQEFEEVRFVPIPRVKPLLHGLTYGIEILEAPGHVGHVRCVHWAPFSPLLVNHLNAKIRRRVEVLGAMIGPRKLRHHEKHNQNEDDHPARGHLGQLLAHARLCLLGLRILTRSGVRLVRVVVQILHA
mmetsp:Transcript_108712/g.306365  ORF Transcript_108712/g.306365 Transcript_108712/m.306365 type:complete len:201 (+) Transcript_108712:1752-2354(+)